MARTFSQKMKELRRIAKLHANWLVYATLGESAITKEELEELKKYGKLPTDSSLDLIDRSYLLGRLKALLKKSEYRQVPFEEAAEKASKMKLSPLEELVVEQARLKAGSFLRTVAADINNGVYAALSASIGAAVTEATVKNAIADETALAVIYKKTAQELASSIASRLQTSEKKRWLATAKTELHRAKVSGHAQAIINKLDIYKNSDGANSEVSVVPSDKCCDDCRALYLDKAGNPKIFKLADLVAAGYNSDPGVVHKKSNGRHVHWKVTLPPLHPNCGCQLQYIPPGFGWKAGKLETVNKSLFEISIAKARAGVSGGISPTVQPQGPVGAKKEPGMPSVAGVAAPGNVPGPGRPPGTGGGGGSGAPKIGGGGGGASNRYSPCPFGGGDDCLSHGGNGAENHLTGGSIMQRHQEAIARGAKPKITEDSKKSDEAADALATQFAKLPHEKQELFNHLSEGKIATFKVRGTEGVGGRNASYKITIEGNGPGLMKPAIDYDGQSLEYFESSGQAEWLAALPPADRQLQLDGISAPGKGTMTPGMHPHSEAGAYGLSTALGLGDLVPLTVVRHAQESEGLKAVTSVMQWRTDVKPVDDYAGSVSSAYADLSISVPEEHKDRFHEQISTVAVLDAVWNNNDRHLDNIMMSDDHNVVAIDHGTAFANGLSGHRNDIASEMHLANHALEIPTKLQSQLKNMTLTSTLRSLDSSGLPTWAKAQTFLRSRYVTHMQDTFGHIPFERLRGTLLDGLGNTYPYTPSVNPNSPEHWDDPMSELALDGSSRFQMAKEKRELPHDMFERWAKNYMLTASADKSHPDHEDAKALLKLNPLRSSGHVTGRDEPTAVSLKAHFDSIPEYSLSNTQIEDTKKKKGRSILSESSKTALERTPPQIATKKKVGSDVGSVRMGPGPKPRAAVRPSSVIALSDADIEVLQDSSKKLPENLEGRVFIGGGVDVPLAREPTGIRQLPEEEEIALTESDLEEATDDDILDADLEAAFDRLIGVKKSMRLFIQL